MKTTEKPQLKIGTHSFRINTESELRRIETLIKKTGLSFSELVRQRLFNKRDRHRPVQSPPADEIMKAELSNMLGGMIHDYRKGMDIMLDLVEAKQKVDQRIA